MASFRWPRLEEEPSLEEDLSERYARIEGNDVDPEAVKAWTTFVRALERGQWPDWRLAFSAFVRAVQPLQRVTSQPRVFVSHRQKDGPIAEQIAWQATEAAMDYWLDLHDGTLKLANNTLSQTDPRYALIIAGIIEMALLSCTHVIATHTQNSLGSKWIPYELARAKSRQITSRQAAGWFHKSILKPETQGEYVVLAEILRTRAEVDGWLGAPPPLGVPARPYLGTPNPPIIVFN